MKAKFWLFGIFLLLISQAPVFSDNALDTAKEIKTPQIKEPAERVSDFTDDRRVDELERRLSSFDRQLSRVQDEMDRLERDVQDLKRRS